MTLTFARDFAVRAAIGGWSAGELLGGLAVGDRKLTLIHGALIAAGWEAPDPSTAHKILIDGKSFNVQTATAGRANGVPVAWEIQARA